MKFFSAVAIAFLLAFFSAGCANKDELAKARAEAEKAKAEAREAEAKATEAEAKAEEAKARAEKAKAEAERTKVKPEEDSPPLPPPSRPSTRSYPTLAELQSCRWIEKGPFFPVEHQFEDDTYRKLMNSGFGGQTVLEKATYKYNNVTGKLTLTKKEELFGLGPSTETYELTWNDKGNRNRIRVIGGIGSSITEWIRATDHERD